MNYLRLPTQERLKELFDYNPETGEFIRKIKTNGFSKPGSVAGSLNKGGYVKMSVDKRMYQAHRLAWMYVYGEDPGKLEVDHRNHIKNDNRIANLRLSTHIQNGYNREGFSKTGYKGVKFHKYSGLYEALITINKKRKYLGYFKTPEEASEAYQKASREHHGVYSCLSNKIK